MTASVTVSPRYFSASAFIFASVMALTCSAVYSLPSMSTTARPPWPSLTSYGTVLSSEVHSEYLRPMKRLMENTVFLGLVTAWFLAALPTTRSPSARKPTTDGVVRSPSAFTMMVGEPPSRTAIAELVVPRSIPRILPIRNSLSLVRLHRLGGLPSGLSVCLSGCSVSPYGPEYTKSKSIHIRFLIT